MPEVHRDNLLDSLRDEVARAGEEFESARAELSAACKIVPDIGLATPDGTALWERTSTRYKRAEQAYGVALKRFARTLHDLRLL